MENFNGGNTDCAIDSTMAAVGAAAIGLAALSNPVG